MSTATSNIQFDATTDANFRAVGSAVAALIPTGGFWTQAGDSGQINWSTVTSPGTSSYAGFEIYVSNDSLSSAYPIYMKVEYGCDAQATKGPLLRFSFGTGTNGAGTLTGNVSSTYTTVTSANGTGATTYQSFAAGGAGRWSMFLWNTASPSNISMAICIERSLDASGNYTSSYVTWLFSSSAVFSQRSMMKPSYGTFTAEATSALTLNWTTTSGSAGTNVMPFPVFPFQGFADNPMTVVMGMKPADIAEGGTFDVTLYGASHHYLWTNRTYTQILGTAGLGWAMRYE
jgi:hypothetical protein